MLNRVNFEQLHFSIDAVTEGDHEIKGGLKHGLFYVLRNAALIWKATFLVEDRYKTPING